MVVVMVAVVPTSHPSNPYPNTSPSPVHARDPSPCPAHGHDQDTASPSHPSPAKERPQTGGRNTCPWARPQVATAVAVRAVAVAALLGPVRAERRGTVGPALPPAAAVAVLFPCPVRARALCPCRLTLDLDRAWCP